MNDAKPDVASLPAKLLPCPFCGETPSIGTWKHAVARHPGATAIECSGDLFDCPVNPTATGYTQEEAIAAWNRRLATPEQPGSSVQGEADDLLREWGLDPERFRSEGGWLNPGKIRAALLNPDDYAGLYLPRSHAFTHSAKLGGEFCQRCGVQQGTARASMSCNTTPPPAPAADNIADAGKKAQPEAQGVEGMVLAFRRHYPEGGHSGWYDATMESDLLRALQGSGQSIEFAYSATPNPVRAEQPEGKWKLPCDVRLPPATTINAGCDLSTLIHAMECRKDAGVVHFPPKSAPAAPGVRVDEAMVGDVRADIMRSAANDGCPIVIKDAWVREALTAALAPDGGEMKDG